MTVLRPDSAQRDLEPTPEGSARAIAKSALRIDWGETGVEAQRVALAAVAEIAALTAENARLREALQASEQSRTHYKVKSDGALSRNHRLRHKKRALEQALDDVLKSETLDHAKLRARVGLNGWSDDELVYESRAALKGKTDE